MSYTYQTTSTPEQLPCYYNKRANAPHHCRMCQNKYVDADVSSNINNTNNNTNNNEISTQPFTHFLSNTLVHERVTRAMSTSVTPVSCPKQNLFLILMHHVSKQLERNNPHKYRYNELIQLMTHVRKYCLHRKIRAYLHDIQENIFIPKENKDAFFELFYLTQRRYHALSRFRYHLQWKSRTHSTIDDLSFTPIPQHEMIRLCIDNTIYTFSRGDIIKIIVNALTYIETTLYQMYNYINTPKNPYTNKTFSKSALYEIYWQLQNTGKKIPMIITNFFQTGFSIGEMHKKYAAYVHKLCVERFIREMSLKYAMVYGKCMIHYMNVNHVASFEIHISNDFPSELFQKYLSSPTRNYIRGTYLEQYYPEISSMHLSEAKDYIRTFFKKNPRFGRKIINTTHMRRRRLSQTQYTTPNPNDFTNEFNFT